MHFLSCGQTSEKEWISKLRHIKGYTNSYFLRATFTRFQVDEYSYILRQSKFQSKANERKLRMTLQAWQAPDRTVLPNALTEIKKENVWPISKADVISMGEKQSQRTRCADKTWVVFSKYKKSFQNIHFKGDFGTLIKVSRTQWSAFSSLFANILAKAQKGLRKNT